MVYAVLMAFLLPSPAQAELPGPIPKGAFFYITAKILHVPREPLLSFIAEATQGEERKLVLILGAFVNEGVIPGELKKLSEKDFLTSVGPYFAKRYMKLSGHSQDETPEGLERVLLLLASRKGAEVVKAVSGDLEEAFERPMSRTFLELQALVEDVTEYLDQQLTGHDQPLKLTRSYGDYAPAVKKLAQSGIRNPAELKRWLEAQIRGDSAE